jgi:flagella basal body P-ring formation protein FlgA
MIIYYFLSLFTLVFATFSWSCEIHLPENILIISEKADLSKMIAASDCQSNIISEVNKTLLNSEGKVSHLQLTDIFKSKNMSVTFRPHLIQIQHLKNLIHDQLALPVGVHMRSSEAINANNFLELNPGDQVEINCVGCLYGSQQPINVIIHGIDGKKTSILARADFKKMVKALRVTSFQPAFSEIFPTSFREDFTEAIPHTDLFSDVDKLKFYKLNKPLRAGDLVRRSDLNPINLVRAGSKTEVVIENKLIMLKTSGISRSNGGIGEYVEVFHPQKNKKYQGRVIDLNKVLVEL